MFAHQLRAAVEAAPRTGLVELSAALWKAFAANAVTEAEAEELSGLIEARKAVEKSRKFCNSSLAVGSSRQIGNSIGPAGSFPTSGNLSPPADLRVRTVRNLKPQRPPVRSVAIERRRRLAASGPMPPALAARFTTGELAVLRIVADEFRDRGSCSLCLDAIAARAGVSRSLAKGAIRQARRLGMVEVIERRRTGAKSLPNVVTVVDREWLGWIKRGRKSRQIGDSTSAGIGGRNSTTTETRGFREGGSGAAQGLIRRPEPPKMLSPGRAARHRIG